MHLPYYTCNAMLEPIEKLEVECQFYHLDTNLEPCIDPTALPEDESFVYTNYFGLKDRCVEALAQVFPTLIVDNAQSFFSKPLPGVDVFYSPRKFFGVPDGAYLYTGCRLNEPLVQDRSELRFEHLLLRSEYDPERGYPSYQKNERDLRGLPIRSMSNLTQRLLGNIDYAQIPKKRRVNFMALHERLGPLNKLKLTLSDSQTPMVYPFWTDVPDLRRQLIENRIYVAQYWPNVLLWTESTDLEYDMAVNIVPLPIDQRYSVDIMDHITDVVRDILR